MIFNIIYITGYFNATSNDIKGTWNITGHIVNDTWIVEHFRIFPSIGKLTIYFDNLLNNSRELSKYYINSDIYPFHCHFLVYMKVTERRCIYLIYCLNTCISCQFNKSLSKIIN